MIDTHCHLTFRNFEGRVDEVVADARSAGVRGMITVSTTTSNCADNLALAEQYDNVWFSAGVHPLHADEPAEWSKLGEAAAHEKCVAWGELGLDNHYDEPLRAIQDEVLEKQLAYIQSQSPSGAGGGGELDKPIIVHCREAFSDLLPIFESTPFDPSRFVFHCFTGTLDEARRVLDFGAFISFTGVVTFKNAREVAEAAKLVPADRIMVETDAPFLTPAPNRKVWPNEPKYVVDVARHIAELRGVDATEFEQQLDANAERFFGITLPEA